MSEQDVSIELRDGTHLAASLYLPDEAGPFPVVLEALPYRKDDLTASYSGEYRRLRDEGNYAVARLDLRGTGSSEGIAEDEYPVQEQEDLAEVLDWLSSQEWSTGAVGMYGTSYSGFNSIQMAMERPGALKAIVAIFGTDDRYTDDVHYEGGVLKAMDFVDYCIYMTPMNALPPVPSLAGEGWREIWSRRFHETEPWIIRWLEEQNDGPYWRHGSLRPAYHSVECPTMIVAGWADGYRNNSFRTFERLRCPKRLLIGPWPHASVETCLPGPHIDLVPEMIRWWDRWLRGRTNGIDEEPPITVFVRRSTPPAPDLAEMRGEWRFESKWPPDRLRETSHDLTPARDEGEPDLLPVRGDIGHTASISCAGLMPWVQPMDQRPDEAYSLTYDLLLADHDIEILGYPRLEATISSSAPVAFLSAKLCDVFPDGTSALVSRGLLNLTHRDSHQEPAELEPGREYEVTVELSATSWVFERGHRIRLDLAGTDWPNAWSPPAPVTITVWPRRSRLVLPMMEAPDPHAPRPTLHPPPSGGPSKSVDDSGPTPAALWRVEHDVIGRESRVVVDHGSTYGAGHGARVTESYYGVTAVSTDDPGSARAEAKVRYTIEWPEATVATETRSVLRSDARAYHLEIELDALDGGKALWHRSWSVTVPRLLQ